MTVEVLVPGDAKALADEAARRFIASAADAISARGQFNVALAGGSTPGGLYRLLAQPDPRDHVDWSRTFIYFGDERCVPPDHPDSNYRMVRETLLDHVPIPAANVFRMAGELPPDEAASRYAEILRQDFHLQGSSRPRFDLILLGMGEDGHTASLFPGMPALLAKRQLAVATNVPADARPAVPRITLTLPVLNAALQVLFLVAGANKAAMTRAALSGSGPPRSIPAALVRPMMGGVTWLLDEAAAMALK